MKGRFHLTNGRKVKAKCAEVDPFEGSKAFIGSIGF